MSRVCRYLKRARLPRVEATHLMTTTTTPPPATTPPGPQKPVHYSDEDVSARERAFGSSVSGWFILPALLAGAAAVAVFLATNRLGPATPFVIIAAVLAFIFILKGLFVLNPNEAAVIQLAGRYIGSIRRDGFHWILPFYSKQRVSLRVRNFESQQLKVNDHDGNPIEIASIVVWRVRDTAEAMFEVDDYENYVRVQTEAALRNLATHHPYDAHGDNQLSLRANTDEVAAQLKVEVQDRLDKAGVEVIEARISHLAYAQEIAAAMLRRQQASAIVAARQKIVEGAVGMVQMALELLAKERVVQLDEQAKAQMVANLMVVLCAEHSVQPVVNTGAHA
jgi:regulator of protease activity HflC (stomatin/prohibitin superfamily)